MPRAGFAAVCGVLTSTVTTSAGPDPWADRVVSFTPGNDPTPGFADPAAALGEPSRFTGVGSFPGAVTPFNPPFDSDQLVSLGAGGELVVAFDEPVRNDARNPFGIDLLVFGNTGFIDGSFPTGVVAGVFGAEGGSISVSPDGSTWFDVSGVMADGLFPTLGYQDLAGPYDPMAGAVPTDFTRPVDPSFDPIGASFGEIVQAYAGSGGGAGIDIGPLRLSEISFVRVRHASGLSGSPEIDGFADVSAIPAPGTAVIAALALAGWRRRGR
jgi:hypothetical protein